MSQVIIDHNTGPAHWELLQRARALDNQLYVASCSPARDETSSYIAYGHSMVINPWGEVIQSATEKEEVVTVDIDQDKITHARESIPCSKQKRYDVYSEIRNPGIVDKKGIQTLISSRIGLGLNLALLVGVFFSLNRFRSRL